MNNLKTRRSFGIKNFVLPVVYCLLPVLSMAQKDSTKKTTININSAYKPVLRNAVKINFSASHAPADTTAPKLEYEIPAENLSYTYQPISINPINLRQDSSLHLGTRNYIKAGYGNFTTPYLNAGFSFGDGKKSLLNVNATYISSKGKIKYQDYTHINLNAAGNYYLAKHEVFGDVSVNADENYLYGYDHTINKFQRKEIRQQFLDVETSTGIRNTVIDDYRISYSPSLKFTQLIKRDNLSETSVLLTAPVTKQFGDAFSFKAEGKADLTFYSAKNSSAPKVQFNNHVIQVAPSLVYTIPGFSINGGIIPTWDNGNFVWLPNVYAEAKIKKINLLFQAGWVGRYTKNTYRNLNMINPYLQTITSQTNTKEIEFYGGVKVTIGKHFNINAKAGLVQYNNLPFLINDTATDNKTFVISNEASVKDIRLHGDISYNNNETFTAKAGITFNGYTFMQSNARAWNTVPVEVNASLRWWAFKQVLLKADFNAFGAGYYLNKGNTATMFRPGTDLSAGIEFKINKTFSAWMDVNNILNDKYQRWHNYEVYGLNLLTGLKISF